MVGPVLSRQPGPHGGRTGLASGRTTGMSDVAGKRLLPSGWHLGTGPLDQARRRLAGLVFVGATAGRTLTRKTPEIIEVDPQQLQEVVRRAEQSLDAQDAKLIRAVFES